MSSRAPCWSRSPLTRKTRVLPAMCGLTQMCPMRNGSSSGRPSSAVSRSWRIAAGSWTGTCHDGLQRQGDHSPARWARATEPRCSGAPKRCRSAWEGRTLTRVLRTEVHPPTAARVPPRGAPHPRPRVHLLAALLLIRVAEATTGTTLETHLPELDRLATVTLTGPAGTSWLPGGTPQCGCRTSGRRASGLGLVRVVRQGRGTGPESCPTTS